MKLLGRSSLSMIHPVVQDDECSISSENSTIAVVNTSKTTTTTVVTKAQVNGRRRRTVHFEEAKNEHYSNTCWYKEECDDSWYSAAEMRMFKAQTIGLAKEIYRVEKTSADKPSSYTNVIWAAYEACLSAPCAETPLNSIQRKQLRKWMQISCSRHGLERMCIRNLAMEKRQRKQHLVDAVLDLQDSLASDEVIRKMSLSISRPSRLFAQQVAAAQANHH